MKMPKPWVEERARRILDQKPLTKVNSSVLDIWRAMPPLPARLKPDIPRMKVMRGNPNSEVCIIAPPPNEKDYEQGTPLSSPAALMLHELLLEVCGLNTQKCCVFSVSRFGLKPNKASTQDVVEAYSKMRRLNQFKLVITVGDDAFKYVFARGKKPAPSIFGNIMYVPETSHKPLFALPELLGLHVTIPDDPRTRAKILDWQDKVERRFRELLEILVPITRKLRF